MMNEGEMKKNSLHMVTFALLIIGGLNWLALTLFNWDISQIFGGMQAPVSRVIYVLVGLSAIFELAMHKKLCRQCSMMTKGSMGSMGGTMGGKM